MRHLKYLLAAAALGSIIALPQAGSAGPLAWGTALWLEHPGTG
jgi:hypothetical protein